MVVGSTNPVIFQYTDLKGTDIKDKYYHDQKLGEKNAQAAVQDSILEASV